MSERSVLVTGCSSGFGLVTAQSHYVASKCAVEGWAESLSMEVRHFGIRVSCVEPGPYATDIWESSPRTLPADSPYADFAGPFQRFVDERVIPRARDPKEVAETIAAALESPRPHFRYAVGPEAKASMAMRGVVPDRAFERITARVVGLPRR